VGVVPKLKVHRSVTKALKIFDADRLRWLDEAAAIGPLVGLRMGPVTTWVVTDAELARTMLVAEGTSWMRPPATVVPIRLGVGENLFSQSDRAWARLQPLVAPTFRKKALEPRLAEIDALVDDEVRAIPMNETIDLQVAMGRIALRLAAWVLLGEHLDSARAEELAHHQREVVRWVGQQLGQLNGFLPVAIGTRAREMKGHRAALRAYADEVVARAQAKPHTDDVLGALMRAQPSGRSLTRSELRGHVLGLFLAGNETTAAALSWALVHAANAPDEWAAVRSDPSRKTLPFVTESLRLTPAVWGIPRTPNRARVTLTAGGVTTRVRRGQLATVYLRGINRDPTTWSDPMQFLPARHEPADKDQQRSLLPFGLGPRGCIGQHLAMAEISAAVPALARRGDIRIEGEIAEDASFSLRVRGGLHGRITSARPAREGANL
jgi:cytochrome P450